MLGVLGGGGPFGGSQLPLRRDEQGFRYQTGNLRFLPPFHLCGPHPRDLSRLWLSSWSISKAPSARMLGAPAERKRAARVCALDRVAIDRALLQLHDFPEVTPVSVHCKSQRGAVYSPADAGVTEWHPRGGTHSAAPSQTPSASPTGAPFPTKAFTCHLLSHDSLRQVLIRNGFDHPVSHAFFRNGKLNKTLRGLPTAGIMCIWNVVN